MEMWRNPLADRVLEADAEPELLGPVEGDSLDFLQSLYRDPALPSGVRMRAAIAALPFERPKLAVTVNASSDDLAMRLDGMRRRCAAEPQVTEHETAQSVQGKIVASVGAPFASIRRG